tara:strand:- start:4313 stop:4507 length:195 start_codon:yes stop_codon:yes gene_type:complete
MFMVFSRLSLFSLSNCGDSVKPQQLTFCLPCKQLKDRRAYALFTVDKMNSTDWKIQSIKKTIKF